MILLTLCASSARAATRPVLPSGRNTGPEVICAYRSHARNASTGRPTIVTVSPASADAALVRRSCRASTGTVGPLAAPGSAATGSPVENILDPQADDFGAAAAAGAESEQQQGAVANIDRPSPRAGREKAVENVARDRAGALALARPIGGADRQSQRHAHGRRAERPVDAAQAMQRRPQGQAPTDGRRRVRAGGAQRAGDVSRHTVRGVALALAFVPQVMGDEPQHDGFRRRPVERDAGAGPRPGFEIGEVRGERAQAVRTGACPREMGERGDLVRRQLVGQTVAQRERKSAGEAFGRAVEGHCGEEGGEAPSTAIGASAKRRPAPGARSSVGRTGCGSRNNGMKTPSSGFEGVSGDLAATSIGNDNRQLSIPKTADSDHTRRRNRTAI